MKIIFTESFDINNWNAEKARTECGVSGTHWASIYLAEGLAKRGHDVSFVSIKNNIAETNYNNVEYINCDNFKEDACDYIITTFFLQDLNILDKIKKYNKIIILMNNDLCEHRNLFRADKYKVIIAYLSMFGKINIENVQPFLKDYNNIILPNSIDIESIYLEDNHINEKEKALAFFACYDRGFYLVKEIIKHFPDFLMYYNSYYPRPPKEINNNRQIIKTDNSSKQNTWDYLRKARYFVYPLINLDNNCIHYDTFCYSILEALLHGVIVITPKIGLYEELYGDSICYVETDDIIPKHDLLYWKKINPNFGYPIMERYIDKIKLLEKDAVLRNSYIQKGILLKNKFSNYEIGKVLMESIGDKL